MHGGVQVFDSMKHDAARWGAAITSDEPPRDLVRLADVVKGRIDDRRPLREAARSVIDVLEAAPVTEWFLLDQGDRAKVLSPADLWCPPVRQAFVDLDEPATGHRVGLSASWNVLPASSPWATFDPPQERVGLRGLVGCLRDCWTTPGCNVPNDLDRDDAGARVALLRSDVLRLFGEARANVANGVVQPIGGTWPHAKDVRWTEAEIVAIYAMRDNGMSEVQIAGVVGCSRQLVSQKAPKRRKGADPFAGLQLA